MSVARSETPAVVRADPRGIPVDVYLDLRRPWWGWFEAVGVIVARDGFVQISADGWRVLEAVWGVGATTTKEAP